MSWRSTSGDTKTCFNYITSDNKIFKTFVGNMFQIIQEKIQPNYLHPQLQEAFKHMIFWFYKKAGHSVTGMM